MKKLILLALFTVAITSCTKSTSDEKQPQTAPVPGVDQGGTVNGGGTPTAPDANTPATGATPSVPETQPAQPTEPAQPEESEEVQVANFNAAAKGDWLSAGCFANEVESYRLLYSFYGNTQGRKVQYMYSNTTCSGRAKFNNTQYVTYFVDHFARGGGKISIDEKPYEVKFSGDKMELNSEEGSMTFQKTHIN